MMVYGQLITPQCIAPFQLGKTLLNSLVLFDQSPDMFCQALSPLDKFHYVSTRIINPSIFICLCVCLLFQFIYYCRSKLYTVRQGRNKFGTFCHHVSGTCTGRQFVNRVEQNSLRQWIRLFPSLSQCKRGQRVRLH